MKFCFLSIRFKAGFIYTYIGEVCISVNPYRALNIYGQDYINQYKGNLTKIFFISFNFKLSYVLFSLLYVMH